MATFLFLNYVQLVQHGDALHGHTIVGVNANHVHARVELSHVQDIFVLIKLGVEHNLAEDAHHSDAVHVHGLDGHVALRRVREQGDIVAALANAGHTDHHVVDIRVLARDGGLGFATVSVQGGHLVVVRTLTRSVEVLGHVAVDSGDQHVVDVVGRTVDVVADDITVAVTLGGNAQLNVVNVEVDCGNRSFIFC